MDVNAKKIVLVFSCNWRAKFIKEGYSIDVMG